MATAVWLMALPVAAQVQPDIPSAREEPAARVEERNVVFLLDKNPSLRVGRLLRLDVHWKTQADWRDFPLESNAASGDVFELHRARLAIDGRFLEYFEYQVEREMRGVKRPWRDVYLNVRPYRAVQIQLGRFKIPFSLEQLTGSTDLNFAYRSRASAHLAPGRDVGVTAHGAVLRNKLRYEAGLFRTGGDNARAVDEGDSSRPRTIAGRVVTRPWNGTQTRRWLRTLALGAAFTAGDVSEGLNGLRAETIRGDAFVDPVYVNGRRRRAGVELQWRPGPASVQGEIIRAYDERRAQGIDNDDLPDAVGRGWYLSGTWLITGETKKENIEPARPFLQEGIGALELAARVEDLMFGSRHTDGLPSPGPRARRMFEKKDTIWTVGMNWYLNEYVKVQANIIRERREVGGIPLPSPRQSWTPTLRVQFQL